MAIMGMRAAGAIASSAVYYAHGVVFDGTDYFTRSSALSGVSDGKEFTFVASLRNAAASLSTLFEISDASYNATLRIAVLASGVIQVSGDVSRENTSTAGDYELTGTTWRTVMISIDRATGTALFYFGDTAATLGGPAISNANFTFTDQNVALGAQQGSSPAIQNEAEIEMADVFFIPQFIDFTVEANRRKFYTPDGKPANKGADGSLVTGTAPPVFFSGDATNFPTNRGSGGSFTQAGTLTNSSVDPSA